MARSNEIDMLHGPLFMKILKFAVPLAASSVLQQLFNSVDVAVVGRFASSQALAAVGSNGPVINLLINLFVGISMGANVIISNHIGQDDKQSIRKAINTVGLVSIFGGIFLMILGVTIARPILEMMDTPDDVLDMAVLYLRIYFLGIPFFLIFNFGASILRSMGDTRRPLYILFAAGIVNTILNLVFVICFHMSVAGVAIATGIANIVSAACIVYLLLHENEPFKLHVKEFKIDNTELKRILQIGVPAGIQSMVFSFSNVFLQSAINSYGSAAIAGSAAALNFEYYCYFLVVAFDGAAISFIGQNYGAGKNDRVRRIFWICLAMAIVTCGVANMAFVLNHTFVLEAFSTDPKVLHYGTIRMTVALSFQWIACIYEIAGSSLRGMGKSLLPAIITIFGTCIIRMGWVFFYCPYHHNFGGLISIYPTSWALTSILMSIVFYKTYRKLKMEPSPNE